MKRFANVVLLAGGKSKRFWPLTDKSLQLFLQKPLFIHQLETVAPFADNLIVVVNHTTSHIFKSMLKGLSVTVVVQSPDIIGQAGAILSLPNTVKGEVLLLNANDIFDDHIIASVNRKRMGLANLVITTREIQDYFPGGYIRYKNNKPVEVVEKPDPKRLPSNQFKMICDYFDDIDEFKKILMLTKTDKDNWYEIALTLWMKRSSLIEEVRYVGQWASVKYPWHMLDIMNIFLNKLDSNRIPKNALISQNTVIAAPVFLGENVKIGDFVKIVGPCFIGDNTIIGDNTLVRQSHIGSDCLIGAGSEVVRSYLGTRVRIHRNYIGDSVISDDVLFGAGAVTANFRFDEKNPRSMAEGKRVDVANKKFGAVVGTATKIGVNAIMYPGVKIGKNCWIAPGETVRADIADNVFYVNGKMRTKKI